jgi:hypothetical protein
MPSFEIQSGDETVILEVVENFNSIYKTDFKVTKFEEDDFIMFATIEYQKESLSDIFDLGGYFEAKVNRMRQKKEIDW